MEATMEQQKLVLSDSLIRLVQSGSLEGICSAIQDQPGCVDLADEDGNTLLDYAIGLRKVGLVRALIVMGAKLDVADGTSTYLHDAVDVGGQAGLDIGRALLSGGADTNLLAFNDWTPLHRAAEYGYVDFVKLLLEYGADPNARTRIDERDTPLMTSARAGHVDVVRVLLERGADASLQDSCGRTALMIADREGHGRIVELLRGHSDTPGQKAT
jgi:ankyrin repeat protein